MGPREGPRKLGRVTAGRGAAASGTGGKEAVYARASPPRGGADLRGGGAGGPELDEAFILKKISLSRSPEN